MVVILLSTYNGSLYSREQISSIQDQSFKDWALLVRDDGSSDNAYALLQDIQQQDERIHVLPKAENIGVIQSFAVLAKQGLEMFPQVNYFMFADQDDVWLPFKVEKTLVCMLKLEEEHTHVLVHTDLKVVNTDLKPIAPSFMKFQHIKHEGDIALQVLLVQNFVTGCTVMVNRELLASALPIPQEVMMHDWWLALCAAGYGKVGFVSQPTMLYRQHQGNSVGAKGFWCTLWTMFFSPKELLTRRERFVKVCQQAKALRHMLQTKCIGDRAQLVIVTVFTQLPLLHRFQRIALVHHLQVKPQFWIRKLAFWWNLICMSRQDKS